MDVKDVIDALKKLEDRVIDLIAKQAEHNIILQEHKNYSIALQKEQEQINQKLQPIQRHVNIMEVVLKMAGLSAIAFIGQALIRRFL